MAFPESTQFTDGGAIKRFFGRIVGERFSGFVDFDFDGRKRRLFFDDGRVFSAQSAVAGENLADQLLGDRLIDDAARGKALALAREKKTPLEAALIESGVSADKVLAGLAGLCAKLVRACLGETRGSAKATEKADLRARMKGEPQDLMQLLTEPVPDKNEPIKLEIRAAHAAMVGKDHYTVLGVAVDDGPDMIKKRYFELAKKWHTDNFAKLDLGPDKELLEQIFATVSDAYNFLSDPEKKREYDTIRDRKARGLPTDVKDIMLAEQMFHRGDALLKRNEFEAALKEMEEAKNLNPGEAEFLAGYGLALYLAKPDRSKDAIAALLKSVEMQPKMPRAFEGLGRIYRALGDNQKAKYYFEKCLALDPKNINAQREIRLMNMRKESGKHEPVKESGGLLGKLFKKS